MTQDWEKALRFAALPGAAKVYFERRTLVEDGTPTVRYSLRSVTSSGEVIGDDRDYDLLKAAMTPLERLAEAHGATPLNLEFDLESNTLAGLEKG